MFWFHAPPSMLDAPFRLVIALEQSGYAIDRTASDRVVVQDGEWSCCVQFDSKRYYANVFIGLHVDEEAFDIHLPNKWVSADDLERFRGVVVAVIALGMQPVEPTVAAETAFIRARFGVPEIESLLRRVEALEQEKETLVAEQQFEQAVTVRAIQRKHRARLALLCIAHARRTMSE